MNDHNVHTRAILVSLNISQWVARKMDKKVSKEVADIHNVDASVGAYYKALIDGSALKPIQKHVGECRLYHLKMTLPWSDSGPRVLSNAAYFEYMQFMQAAKTKFEQLYAAFEVDYALHIAAAQRTRGALFNPNEYPDVDALRRKFAFNVSVQPMPVADDIRVDLAQDEVDRLRQQVREQTESLLHSTVIDVYQRAMDIVERYVDRLSDTDNVFRDSMVEGTREFVELIPKLNITNDPNLTKLADEMRAMLCAHEPQALRTNMTARKDTCQGAKEIKKDLLDFFSSFGNAA